MSSNFRTLGYMLFTAFLLHNIHFTHDPFTSSEAPKCLHTFFSDSDQGPGLQSSLSNKVTFTVREVILCQVN